MSESALVALERALSPRFLDNALIPGTVEGRAVMTMQHTEALLVIYLLALRRSSPFAPYDDDGIESTFARVRSKLSDLMCVFGKNIDQDYALDTCGKVLRPVLLRADVLQCYSRLLAAAAEQLQPAAAAMLPASPPPITLPACPALAGEQMPGAGAGGAEPAGQHQHQQQQQQQHQRGNPGSQQGRQAPRHPPPDLGQLQALLCEVANTALIIGVSPQQGPMRLKKDGDTSRQSLRAEVEASCVLEHWARVLLLGTAPALAPRESLYLHLMQQAEAQALQAKLYCSLCTMHKQAHLDWASFVRRPWGCTLAAIQMVLLCSLLDGGPMCGMPELGRIALPTTAEVEQDYLARVDQGAAVADSQLVGRVVSLVPTVHTLRAWILLAAQTMQEAPGWAGAGAGADEDTGAGADEDTGAGAGAQGGGAGSEEGRLLAGTDQQVPADGQRRGEEDPAVGSPSSLPPFNRTATVTLCLRLAKGVLACWGGDGPGARTAAHAASRGESVAVLPKLSGCSALYHALVCARLALLPAVWGRERVPRRTRAQLRTWWETYVAAAQHPEALLVGVPMPLAFEYPGWAHDAHGGLHRVHGYSQIGLGKGSTPP